MGLNVKKNLTIEDVKARKVGLIVIMKVYYANNIEHFY